MSTNLVLLKGCINTALSFLRYGTISKFRHFGHLSPISMSRGKPNLPEFSATANSTKLKFTCFTSFYKLFCLACGIFEQLASVGWASYFSVTVLPDAMKIKIERFHDSIMIMLIYTKFQAFFPKVMAMWIQSFFSYFEKIDWFFITTLLFRRKNY